MQVGDLISQLTGKISPEQAAKIRLQIEKLNLEIAELKRKQLNSLPKNC